MLNDIKESVLMSLDGRNVELFPYIPYLLKDLWELGSSADQVIKLLDQQDIDFQRRRYRILDLGCGKGAVSIPLAKKYGFTVTGIDAVSEFVEIAQEKALEWGVGEMCRFEVGDIREYIQKCPSADIIILGSIGPVFGNVQQTLRALAPCLLPRGMIILDDGYIPDGKEFYHNGYLPEAQYMSQIRRAGFRIIDSAIYSRLEILKSNREIYAQIKKRADELMAMYPGLDYVFQDYIRSQHIENEVLENNVTCALFLIGTNVNHE
ncbi:MAG: class I SAM-dependent methyltransferase [Fidelibacterota bacterium]